MAPAKKVSLPMACAILTGNAGPLVLRHSSALNRNSCPLSIVFLIVKADF